jgi:hypothetical protein
MSCRSQPDYSDDEVQALFQPYKMKVVENIKIIKAIIKVLKNMLKYA